MTTTLTRETWVVKRGAGISAPLPPEWCPGCAGPSGMLTPEEASALAGLSTRAVYALVETGRAHFAERQDGEIFVCLESLKGLEGG